MTVRRDDVRVRLKDQAEEQTAAKPVAAPNNDSLSYLRSVVLDGRTPEGPSSLETNVIVTEILDAARRSAASGQTIPLAVGPGRAISDH